MSKVIMIPLDEIEINTRLSDAELLHMSIDELSMTLLENECLPIVVSKGRDNYKVIVGTSRCLAHLSLVRNGHDLFKEIPAILDEPQIEIN